MARIDLPPERLSDYERAICYYTVPKISHPVTFGLIVVYCVCVFEALGALIYGLLENNGPVTQGGVVALIAIVVFGIVAFMVRAFLNEIRLRKALGVARRAPEAIGDIDDVPNPFATHRLLRRPLHGQENRFSCTDNDGVLQYLNSIHL